MLSYSVWNARSGCNFRGLTDTSYKQSNSKQISYARRLTPGASTKSQQFVIDIIQTTCLPFESYCKGINFMFFPFLFDILLFVPALDLTGFLYKPDELQVTPKELTSLIWEVVIWIATSYFEMFLVGSATNIDYLLLQGYEFRLTKRTGKVGYWHYALSDIVEASPGHILLPHLHWWNCEYACDHLFFDIIANVIELMALLAN